MERIKRNPERFEPLELFSALGQIYDYDIKKPEHQDDFIQKVTTSLIASQQNPIMVNGKRTENLFKHVCAALNQCQFLKQEDAGEMMSTEPDLQAPDYRIMLKDRRQIFVEVKNFNTDDVTDDYRLSKAYSDKVEKYGEIQGIPVYYAIYIRLLRRWTLVSRSSMKESAREYTLTPASALAKSEMYLLGDLSIATEPDLVLELLPDHTKELSVSDENIASFTIGRVKIYCNGREVTDTFEMNTAFHLMRYGEWVCPGSEAIFNNDQLESIRYTFSPQDYDNFKRQGFDSIGTLSSLVTAAFNEQTVLDSQVRSVDSFQRLFTVTIPNDYKGEGLPLWRFSMRPNFDFTDHE
ncbi:hypothetical protein LHL03_07380 [Pectobacterium carotovorum]|uniref:hypothetical protein n=1 Tax=Pectobacterium carotovorum TaxID=554 RepID=UPI001CFB941F|nr:hypothetical protein [Pectobacterium carotovorum]UCZ80944.1 hypothetical protein LHL03_07380 [Pectobacterium carotovorum]